MRSSRVVMAAVPVLALAALIVGVTSRHLVAAPKKGVDADADIDKMRKHFKVDAPGANLLYNNPYDTVLKGRPPVFQ